MKISIAQRLAPFSHVPGASCAIPGTHSTIEAFPTLLRLGEIELRLKWTGPISDFTLQQDLERDCVWIFGKGEEGFFRLRLRASDAGFEFFADRLPEMGMAYAGAEEGLLKRKETLLLPAPIPFHLPPSWERLSLGSHKAQDWDLVLRRFDLGEILPALYALGQKIPRVPPQPLRGTASLLQFPEDKNRLLPSLEAFCRAAFSKILVPRLRDDQHQGLCPEELAEGNPFFLLQEAFRHLRSLFLRSEERRLSLLPCNPFEAGRLISLQAGGIGEFDLEWRQGVLRRAICRAASTGDVVLQLQKELKTFRIRANEREKGRRQSSSEPLFVEAGKTYFFDRFQK